MSLREVTAQYLKTALVEGSPRLDVVSRDRTAAGYNILLRDVDTGEALHVLMSPRDYRDLRRLARDVNSNDKNRKEDR